MLILLFMAPVAIYLAYMLPALRRSSPFEYPGYGGFILLAFATILVVITPLMVAFQIVALLATMIEFFISDEVILLSAALCVNLVASGWCALIQRSCFEDTRLTRPPLFAGAAATCLILCLGLPAVVHPDYLGAESALLIAVIAGIVWHVINCYVTWSETNKVRAERIRAANKCASCMYDLAGIDTDRCPECGMQIAGRMNSSAGSTEPAHHSTN